jgi:murein endopeptidase
MLTAAVATLVWAVWGMAGPQPGSGPDAPARPASASVEDTRGLARMKAGRRERPSHARKSGIAWHRSRAVGLPYAGRLVGGVRLPREGRHFFTWDPVQRRSPDRPWRRYGTARLVRALLAVIDAYAAAHPHAPRVGIGDLSRPHGGDFGPRFGGLGHVSHQNGLDADVYYPRRDRRERAPGSVGQIDHRLAQDLVDRFVRAGAQVIFVGPGTGLRGPPGIVQVLAHHDNHLHVRLPPA